MARVVGCFFFGLALGSAAGAWLAGWVRRPWLWLAGAEAVLIVSCLPMLFLPWWADGVWAWLGPERFLGWEGWTLKTLFSVALVVPPAAVMGLFLPLAIVGWPASRASTRRDPGIWLYAINTLGAVGGILWVLFVLLPRGGVFTGMSWVLAGNAVVVGGCLVLAWVCPARILVGGREKRSRLALPEERLLLMAAASGFLLLAVEVTAMQLVQLLAPLSLFAPAVILASFIGLLAAAGFGVGTMPRRWVTGSWTLCLIPLLAGLALLAAPFLFHALAPVFSFDQDRAHLAGFFVALSGFCLLVFGPSVLVGGFWFPAVALAGEKTGDPRSAERWGWLLAANGAGGWLGAEVAYAGLLPALGLFGCLAALAFFYFLASWIVRPVESNAALRWAWMGVGGIILAANLWLIPGLPVVHPSLAPCVIEQKQGREGSLAVLEHPSMGRALLVQNQYILGSSRATPEQQRQADWPLLMHPDPRRVAFLGVATGITPGAALRHPEVEKISAVEISRPVAEAAGRWFAAENENLLHDTRAEVIIEDARTWLAAQRSESFEVIVSDLFLPWGPGDGRLYSVEHFAAARRALVEGGLFALWLPLYQLTNDQVMVILATFLEVFPEAELMQREGTTHQPVLGILGWKHPSKNHDRSPRVVTSSHVPNLPWQQLHLGTVRRGDITAPINTLGNLWIEWQAGRMRVLQPQSAPYLAGPQGRQWLNNLQDQLPQ
jgi:spermidine synthase